MAYQVFARKYRPQTFREIVGQESVVRTLTNALRLGRIAQAYLFVGPRGTGKTSTARILSKALECPTGPTADFDPNEETAREIAEGRFLDVMEIDGASNNGVEQVRDLRDNVLYAPARGRYKIYIIDEVHMLSNAAFNALLKTLEEPPAHVKFIFATTEVHKLPATILSRCQRFDLRRIPEGLIRAHLAHICALEGVTAEPEALDALARHAEGGMRDAESALDQAISFYGDRVTQADVHALFGLTGFGPVAELARTLAAGRAGDVLKQARELILAGKDLARLSQDLLAFFRNLVIFQTSPEALEKDISMAEGKILAEVSQMLSRGAALDILTELSQLEGRLRYALAKDVIFEVALIQMSQLREKVSLERVLEAIDGASSLPTSPNPRPAAPPATPPTVPPVVSPTPPPAVSLSSFAPTMEAPAPKPVVVEVPPPAPEPAPVIVAAPTPVIVAPSAAVVEPAPVVKPVEPPVFVPPPPSLLVEEDEPVDEGLPFDPDPEPLDLDPPEAELPVLDPEPPAPVPLPAAVVVPAPAPVLAPPPPLKVEPAPVVAPVKPVPPGILTNSVAAAAWAKAVEKFAAERPVEADTIRAVEFMAAKGDSLEVSLPQPLAKKIHYLRSPRNVGILESTLNELLGRNIEVVFLVTTPRLEEVLTDAPPKETPLPGKPVAPAPTMTQEEFVNDPAIQHALKIFEAKLLTTNQKENLK